MTRTVFGYCGNCAGLGYLPTDKECSEYMDCHACGGEGDIDAARLLEAYLCGHRDATESVLLRLAEVDRILALTSEDLQTAPGVTGSRIRQRVGG